MLKKAFAAGKRALDQSKSIVQSFSFEREKYDFGRSAGQNGAQLGKRGLICVFWVKIGFGGVFGRKKGLFMTKKSLNEQIQEMDVQGESLFFWLEMVQKHV